MTDLKAFVDNEFRMLTGPLPRGADRVAQRGQAALLKLPQSSFNRIIRSGRLTPRMASTWAEVLASLGSARSRAELEVALLAAAAATASKVKRVPANRGGDIKETVEGFFQKLETAAREAGGDRLKRPLALVEYRDTPRAERFKSKYPELQSAAASAVAAGLQMALFQPFALNDQSARKPRDPRAVRDYQRDIAVLVRRVAAEMWDGAVALAPDRSPRGQIVLYEWPESAPGVSGLATRMFYIEYFRDGSRCREVWEWIAGKERDVFLERDPQSFPSDAFVQQFIGVYRYWQNEGQLPVERDDVKSSRDAAEGMPDLDMNLRGCPSWSPTAMETKE